MSVAVQERPASKDHPAGALGAALRPGIAGALSQRGRLHPDWGPGEAGRRRAGGRWPGRWQARFCYAQDQSFLGGSLGEAHAGSIVRIMEMAARGGIPLVGFVESGGARLQEGHAALGGYGEIFRRSVELSNRTPQISIVCGVSAGGGAYRSPSLTDFVVMTREGRMFLTGPKVVRADPRRGGDDEELGGARVHGRNGVAQFSVDRDGDAAELARQLLGLLPSRIGDLPPR